MIFIPGDGSDVVFYTVQMVTIVRGLVVIMNNKKGTAYFTSDDLAGDRNTYILVRMLTAKRSASVVTNLKRWYPVMFTTDFTGLPVDQLVLSSRWRSEHFNVGINSLNQCDLKRILTCVEALVSGGDPTVKL